MGLLSWLFPTVDDRVNGARARIAKGDFADARLDLLEIDRDDARALLAEAETGLALKNLDAAVSWARAGDDRKVEQHLQMAESFHHGGLEERFREARREMRELRAARDAEDERARVERETRQMKADPLGVTGGASWLQRPVSEGLYDPEREEIEARFALIVEGYPEALRARVPGMGVDFAKAILDLEDGRADRALPALLALSDDEPLVRWERARCCHALGDPGSAARELRAFAERAGGHHDMGRSHSAELLGRVLTEAGDLKSALLVLRHARQTSPAVGGPLYAQLLLAAGELPEAETVLVGLIRQHPKTQPLYGMLARVRLAGDHRLEAMRALEASQEAVCCTPGKCGSQPPDLDVVRLLATLYLEDGLSQPRALELAETAFALVQKPSWDDVYLKALVARATDAPELPDLLARLRGVTPPAHPGHARLARHFAHHLGPSGGPPPGVPQLGTA